jgi:hypothetical protein
MYGMMSSPMTWGMGIGMVLVVIALVLAAIALARYILTR